MAENEENTLEKLAENVDNLISLCEQADLANANAKIRTLEQKNRTLQSMQLGDVSVVAAKQNKAQLSKLVREIDKCIALLNT